MRADSPSSVACRDSFPGGEAFHAPRSARTTVQNLRLSMQPYFHKANRQTQIVKKHLPNGKCFFCGLHQRRQPSPAHSSSRARRIWMQNVCSPAQPYFHKASRRTDIKNPLACASGFLVCANGGSPLPPPQADAEARQKTLKLYFHTASAFWRGRPTKTEPALQKTTLSGGFSHQQTGTNAAEILF